MMREQLNLELNGVAIPQVKTLKLLGVTLDSYGSWTSEIDLLIPKTEAAALQVRNLAKVMGKSNPKLIKQVTNLVVLSHITYSSPFWVNTCMTNWQKIENLIHRVIKYIWGFPRCLNGHRAREEATFPETRKWLMEIGFKRIKGIFKMAPYAQEFLERFTEYHWDGRHRTMLQTYQESQYTDITKLGCQACSFEIKHPQSSCTGLLLRLGMEV